MSTPQQFASEPRRVWHRKNYDPALLTGTRREIAERETVRDLDKPIEQLLCDVHEESLDASRTAEQNITGAQKRMVSLMVRVAEGNDLVARRMLWLTWAVVAMTAVILFFTVLMWDQNRTKPSKVPEPTPTAVTSPAAQESRRP